VVFSQVESPDGRKERYINYLERATRNDDIDLLFTDISMPGAMDGLALIDRVRAERPEIFFVATSGQAPPEDRATDAGSRFLAKPYTAHALTSLVREIFEGRPETGRPRNVA
jgi:CheY-like chemotaxis protein